MRERFGDYESNDCGEWIIRDRVGSERCWNWSMSLNRRQFHTFSTNTKLCSCSFVGSTSVNLNSDNKWSILLSANLPD